MENSFDLKKYLAEGKLLKEGFFGNMFGKKEKEQELPIELDPSSPLNKVIITDPNTHSKISIGVILSKPEKYQHLFPNVQKAIDADPTGEKATAMLDKKAIQAKKDAKQAAWRRANAKKPSDTKGDKNKTNPKSDDTTQKIFDKAKSDLDRSMSNTDLLKIAKYNQMYNDDEDNDGGFGGGGFSGGGSGSDY